MNAAVETAHVSGLYVGTTALPVVSWHPFEQSSVPSSQAVLPECGVAR
jgi:hypothetical protein